MEISFYLTRMEEGKQTSVYAHVRYSALKFKYYLSEKIDPVFWSFKEQRAKKTNRFPGYMEFNRRLDKVHDKIKDLYSAYCNNHDGKEPAPKVFKPLIDQEVSGRPQEQPKLFTAFLQELHDTAANGSRVQPKNGKPYSRSSIDGFKYALVHLKAYDRQLDLLAQIAKNTGSSNEDVKQVIDNGVTRDNGLPSPLVLVVILFVVAIAILVYINL